MALLREPLLLLSRSGMVKQLVSTMPVSAGIVKSYVPGESTDSAVEATRDDASVLELPPELGRKRESVLVVDRMLVLAKKHGPLSLSHHCAPL